MAGPKISSPTVRKISDGDNPNLWIGRCNGYCLIG